MLWTNPSGGAAFPAQTVTVNNLSDYDFIVFVSQFGANGSSGESYVATTISQYINGKKTFLGNPGTNNTRAVTFNGNNLQFDQGSAAENKAQIPLKVWGMHKHN